MRQKHTPDFNEQGLQKHYLDVYAEFIQALECQHELAKKLVKVLSEEKKSFLERLVSAIPHAVEHQEVTQEFKNIVSELHNHHKDIFYLWECLLNNKHSNDYAFVRFFVTKEVAFLKDLFEGVMLSVYGMHEKVCINELLETLSESEKSDFESVIESGAAIFCFSFVDEGAREAALQTVHYGLSCIGYELVSEEYRKNVSRFNQFMIDNPMFAHWVKLLMRNSEALLPVWEEFVGVPHPSTTNYVAMLSEQPRPKKTVYKAPKQVNVQTEYLKDKLADKASEALMRAGELAPSLLDEPEDSEEAKAQELVSRAASEVGAALSDLLQDRKEERKKSAEGDVYDPAFQNLMFNGDKAKIISDAQENLIAAITSIYNYHKELESKAAFAAEHLENSEELKGLKKLKYKRSLKYLEVANAAENCATKLRDLRIENFENKPLDEMIKNYDAYKRACAGVFSEDNCKKQVHQQLEPWKVVFMNIAYAIFQFVILYAILGIIRTVKYRDPKRFFVYPKTEFESRIEQFERVLNSIENGAPLPDINNSNIEVESEPESDQVVFEVDGDDHHHVESEELTFSVE